MCVCVCVCQGPQDPQVSSFNASNSCRSLGPPTGRTPLNPPASHGALHPHIPCDANSHGPGKWTSTRLYMMKTNLICHSVGSTVVLCRYERMAWPLRGRHLAENTWKPLGLDNCSFGILLQGVGSLWRSLPCDHNTRIVHKTSLFNTFHTFLRNSNSSLFDTFL